VDADKGLATGEVAIPRLAEPAGPAAAFSPVFSADGRSVAVGVSDGRVVRLDVAKREVVDLSRLPAGVQPRRVGFVGTDVWMTSIDEAMPDGDLGDGLPITTRLLRPGVAEPVWTIAGEATMSAGQPAGAAVTGDGDLLLFERASGVPRWRLRPFANGTRWDVRQIS